MAPAPTPSAMAASPQTYAAVAAERAVPRRPLAASPGNPRERATTPVPPVTSPKPEGANSPGIASLVSLKFCQTRDQYERRVGSERLRGCAPEPSTDCPGADGLAWRTPPVPLPMCEPLTAGVLGGGESQKHPQPLTWRCPLGPFSPKSNSSSRLMCPPPGTPTSLLHSSRSSHPAGPPPTPLPPTRFPQ